jgi:hypothetical protein
MELLNNDRTRGEQFNLFICRQKRKEKWKKVKIVFGKFDFWSCEKNEMTNIKKEIKNYTI